MLRDLIREILEELNQTTDRMEENISAIIDVLKSSAKKLFFEGKIQDLKDFIFNVPNANSENIKNILADNLNEIVEESGIFLDKLREKIEARLHELKLEKNVESLLKLFDYEHLKHFLKMFKI